MVECLRPERLENQCVHETPNRGYGQVMVWGAITTDHRTALMHLTAGQRRSPSCKLTLEGQHIGVIHPWLAVSPDINPIELVWNFLSRHIQEMNPAPQNRARLIQSLTNTWNAIPQDQISQDCHLNEAQMPGCHCCRRRSHTMLVLPNFSPLPETLLI
ncbi:transposable element tcb1 transposase [Plakobranchus ocellatus]|uniref:Transposable element tcb1 transposase n=1 Tax=Plakobranchus ocellatus TaxID=259542 RepID=A0AAV4A3B1_9GAST|nr:transposable element tcb1 transposase [Plakobranchus ocellatus]